MYRIFLLTWLFAAVFQINASAIGALENQRMPTSETVDLAQYSPSEMKRIRRAIVAFQIELKRIGYYKGPIDGLYGRRTNAAWARFAREHDLSTKRLGNYEYNVLKSVADGVHSRDKIPSNQATTGTLFDGETSHVITAEDLATLSARVLREDNPLSLERYFIRNCQVDPKLANTIEKQHGLLIAKMTRKIKCDTNSEYANRQIDKLKKSPTAVKISVRSVEHIKPVGNGTFPSQKCYVFEGTFGKGSVEHFRNVVNLRSIDHIAISNICPQFEGGNVFEAIDFIERHVAGDFKSEREFLTNYTFGMVVLPHKTCGDVCSLIFLSGYRGAEGEGAFRLMSRTSTITYRSIKPKLKSDNLSGKDLERLIQAVIEINGKLQKLSEQPFNGHVDKYVRTSDKYIIPKSLLKIISKLGDGTYTMPTRVDKSVDPWEPRNKFRVLIYD